METMTVANSPLVVTGNNQTTRIVLDAEFTGDKKEVSKYVVYRQTVTGGMVERGGGHYYPLFNYDSSESKTDRQFALEDAYAKFHNLSDDMILSYPPVGDWDTIYKHEGAIVLEYNKNDRTDFIKKGN